MRSLALVPVALLAMSLAAQAEEPARKFGKTVQELVEDLKAGRGDPGANAAILGEFGAEAFDAGMELAREEKPDVRAWGLYVLGRVGGPVEKLLPVAEEALASADERTKIGAAMVLRRCGKKAGPLLAKALSTETAVPLTWFINTASELGSEATGIEDGLAQAMVNGREYQREDACRVLVARGAPAAAAAERLIRKGGEVPLKWGCEAIARLGPDGASALEALAARLGEEGIGEELEAGVERAMAALGPACVEAAREVALGDGGEERRLAAMRVLALAGPPAAAAIGDVLKAAAGTLRTRLLGAAASAEEPPVAALSDASRTGPEGDRLIAVRALARRPGPHAEALPALARALEDGSAEVRLAAWEGIAALPWSSERVREAMTFGLSHADAAIRARAVTAVFQALAAEYAAKTTEKGPPGYMGSTEAAAVAERAIADPDPEVARAALGCFRDWETSLMFDVELKLPHPLLAALLRGLDRADEEIGAACEGKVGLLAGKSRNFVKTAVLTIGNHPERGRARMVRALSRAHADARPIVRELLVEFLADEDEAVRAEAKKTIEALGEAPGRR
ncbi:MAG: hypothetical protein IT452_18620 [Planctomycetia bacterium]|nr:hypothetical protein [Planctomycetia bacterium]